MTETLKPCPLCGARAGAYAGHMGTWWTVKCSADGCRLQLPDAGETEAQAAAAWNTRAAPREPGEAERIARMEAALKLAATEFGRLWIAFDRGDSRRARVNELEQAMLDALAARPDAGDGTGETG